MASPSKSAASPASRKEEAPSREPIFEPKSPGKAPPFVSPHLGMYGFAPGPGPHTPQEQQFRARPAGYPPPHHMMYPAYPYHPGYGYPPHPHAYPTAADHPMSNPYHGQGQPPMVPPGPSPAPNNARGTTPTPTGGGGTQHQSPAHHESPSSSIQNDSGPSTSIPKKYIKTTAPLPPDQADRRMRKNSQARMRAAKLREQMDEIESKPKDLWTEEEKEAYENYQAKRNRKNYRSKERSLEKRAEIERILAIPERKRSQIEKDYLVTNLTARYRKNEGDRRRRAMLKQMKQISEHPRQLPPPNHMQYMRHGMPPYGFPPPPPGVMMEHPYSPGMVMRPPPEPPATEEPAGSTVIDEKKSDGDDNDKGEGDKSKEDTADSVKSLAAV